MRIKIISIFFIVLFSWGCSMMSHNGRHLASSQLVKADFVRIEAGRFIMGSLGNKVPVTISNSFEMMSTEVTQMQWYQVMGTNPSFFKEKAHCKDHVTIRNISLCPNHPVEQVSWHDTQKYIRRMNNDSRYHYRLPTEAEWEFAAKGGLSTETKKGKLKKIAWYKKNSRNQSQQVGQKKVSPYGLYDIYGNVREWVQDAFVMNLPGGSDPYVPPTEFRTLLVQRGGDFLSENVDNLKSTFRFASSPQSISKRVGFRLVRERVNDDF